MWLLYCLMNCVNIWKICLTEWNNIFQMTNSWQYEITHGSCWPFGWTGVLRRCHRVALGAAYRVVLTPVSQWCSSWAMCLHFCVTKRTSSTAVCGTLASFTHTLCWREVAWKDWGETRRLTGVTDPELHLHQCICSCHLPFPCCRRSLVVQHML